VVDGAVFAVIILLACRSARSEADELELAACTRTGVSGRHRRDVLLRELRRPRTWPHLLFPRDEQLDEACCLASVDAATASRVLPFRLDYLVEVGTIRGSA